MPTLSRSFTTPDNRVMRQRWNISDYATRNDAQIMAFVYDVNNMKYLAIYHRETQPGRDDTLLHLGSARDVVQKFLTRPLAARIINDLIRTQGAASAEQLLQGIIATDEGYYIVGRPGRYSPVLPGRIYSRDLRE